MILGETILKAEHISVKYDRLILRDIHFEIKDIIRETTTGQVCSVIGKSGVGKTQLFKVIAGLQQPTTGQVTAFGKLVKPGDIGVVAQNYPLLPHRTLLGNLKVVCKDSSQIDYYLNEFDLTSHKNKFPIEMSGGQRQRGAIIQQLLTGSTNGKILLMDEPFSGLDYVNKQKLCEIITKVANLNEFNTIIIISHDIESSLIVSDTAWIVGHEFEQAEVDPPGELSEIPGAVIIKQYDLATMGLAWQPGLADNPLFNSLVREIKTLFKTI